MPPGKRYHAGAGLDIDRGWEEGTRAAVHLEARWIFNREESDTLEIRPDGVQYTVGLKLQF